MPAVIVLILKSRLGSSFLLAGKNKHRNNGKIKSLEFFILFFLLAGLALGCKCSIKITNCFINTKAKNPEIKKGCEDLSSQPFGNQ